MVPTFVQATQADTELALNYMAQLYAKAGFVESRARAAYVELLAHPEFGGLWFIFGGGHPAGYIVLTICYSLEFHGRFVLLDELFVATEWRGQGLGAQALAFADEFCRAHGLKAIRLEVGWQNPRALGRYKRSGFRMDDRYLMTKWVSPHRL